MFAYSDFVSAFPEFSNEAVFTVSTINFWIPQAYGQLNAYRFGVQIDLAAMLFVAHNVVLSAREVATANVGGIPGQVTGPVTSKTVGPVSIAYGGQTSLEKGGAWNGTTYGQRLYKMMKAYGVGPFYVAPRPRLPFGVRAWPSL